MWYDIGCSNKIISWREWRLKLDELSWDDCKNEVAKQWHLVPRVNHYLVIDDIDNWPTPWQLINDDIYCDLSIALGILYSLVLTSHKQATTSKLKIFELKNNWVNLCLVDDEKYAVNWDSGKIVNTSILPTNIKLISEYSLIDFKNKLD